MRCCRAQHGFMLGMLTVCQAGPILTSQSTLASWLMLAAVAPLSRSSTRMVWRSTR